MTYLAFAKACLESDIDPSSKVTCCFLLAFGKAVDLSTSGSSSSVAVASCLLDSFII